ncbi:MAG: aminotransferase class I/II-fold pyridoxal phosphate-dependent enzyme [Candidatus Methylomirabilales bacterium]
MRLPAFKLERYFARHEFGAPYVLCASDCESVTIADLLGLEPDARERFDRQALGYTQSPGSPTLRQEITRLYHTIRREEVLVHTGAEEAIFLFMHAALGPGDHAVIHRPCYQSLMDVPRSLGCRVSEWEADEREGWALTAQGLTRLLRPNTRVIVLNTPHNPTGSLMPEETFREVVEIAQADGIVLFSDEVYRESEHEADDRLPAACDLDAQAVSLGVMSKTYGLPGLRIGWVATRNSAILERMAALKDYTTICASAPGEFLAEVALRHREVLTKRNRRIIRDNLRLLDDFLASHADRFSWERPKAGPIGFPRLLGGSADRFCQAAVREAGVLLLPGSVYDDPGEHFRIGFGRRNFEEGLARLEEFLKAGSRF